MKDATVVSPTEGALEPPRAGASAGAEAVEVLRHANTRLEILNDVLSGLGTQGTPDETARAVIERLARALAGTCVGFTTLDARGRVAVRRYACAGSEALEDSRLRSLGEASAFLDALRHQEMVAVTDVREDERFAAVAEPLEAAGVRALLAVGFPRSDDQTDVLSLESSVPRCWREEDAATLLEVAAYLFLALQEAAHREERERAFAAQARITRRLANLVDSIRVGVLEEDRDGRIALVNSAFCRMFGLSGAPEDLVDRASREVLDPLRDLFTEPEAFLPRMYQLVRRGRRVLSEELRLVDGRTFERDFLPGDSRAESVGRFWVFRDITGHKRVEEELRAANGALATANRVLEDNQRKMSLLNEMGDLLLTAKDEAEARDVAAAFLPRIFAGCSGGVYLLTAERQGLEPVVRWGAAAPQPEPVGIDECWALRRSRPHRVHREGSGPACPHAAEARSHESLCVPLMANGQLLGLLHLRQTSLRAVDGAGGLGEGEVDQVAHSTAEHLALGIANLQLRMSLRSQALHDPLTGLHNRRYLEERLGRELQRAVRADAPLAVLMLDLDHFKRINDVYGHTAGDRVLAQVARFLEEGVRAEDVVARYGGEEFTVILAGTSEEDARWVAEKLRKGVRRLAVELRDDAAESLSLSIGLAVSPACGVTASELLQVADAALYEAKRSGRDRVVVAAPALPEQVEAAR